MTTMKNMKIQETLETLTALGQQETRYVTRDFLHQEQPEEEQHAAGPTTARALHIEIDEQCRDKMVAWCFQVAEFCHFSQESIEISMSYLDRFLLTDAGTAALQDRSTYQLACMVCLYTAVKVHEQAAISPAIVSALSRDAYTPAQVEEMERTILQALEWRVNPPTAASFVRLLVELIPQEAATESQRTIIQEIAAFQLELAVKDYRFVAVQRSIVAYCALLNSLDATPGIDSKTTACLSTVLAKALQLQPSQHEKVVLGVSGALYTAVLARQQEQESSVVEPTTTATTSASSSSKQLEKTAPIDRRASFHESPRSVSSSRIAT